jgi:hypothetical protein
VEVAPLLLEPPIVSDAGQSVATPNDFFPHQLPKQDIANSDMWQLRAFLKENKMPFLAQMIKAYSQKRQLFKDKKQRGPAGRPSQIESNFGKY